MRFFYNNDRYNVAYNGVSCDKYGLFLISRPSIPTAEQRITEHEVLGKNGKVYLDTGLVEDRTLSIRIGFYGTPEEWQDKYRAIKTWLQTTTSKMLPFRTLQFSDDTKFYYKVKKITIQTTEREAKDIGEAEIVFVVDGYNYLRRGFLEEEMGAGVLYNSNMLQWSPIVTISRGYDGIDSLARAEITSYISNAYTDFALVGDKKLSVALLQGEGIILDLSVPTAKLVSGANPITSGFNRITGSFQVLLNPNAIMWDSVTAGADLSATIKPLYRER